MDIFNSLKLSDKSSNQRVEILNMTIDDEDLRPLQIMLRQACAGTSVSTRELVKELTFSDLANLREGEMTVDNLKEIVSDLAAGKDDINPFDTSFENDGISELL